MRRGVLTRYRDFLPITPATPVITLGEGETPLLRSVHLEKELGCSELYFKLEGCNPTGSFKDRGMVMAIAKAVEDGSVYIIKADVFLTLRYPVGLLYYAKWFHPDLFEDIDVETIHQELITKYFGEAEWQNLNEKFAFPEAGKDIQ